MAALQIIDTHLHLMDLDRFHYPWLEDVPALRRNFRLDEYLAQARSCGIWQMLHMEVDVAEPDMESETRFVLGLGGAVIGAIAACRPESPGFPAFLERAVANHGVRGFRRVLHTGAHSCAAMPLFIENVRSLARVRRSFDLCVAPQHLPVAAALARACPEVQFVLDHCGTPNIKDQELDPWRRYLRDLAALPNVACKISGVIAYGDRSNWTVEDLRPYVEHAIESFGWDRVVWGSDWPVCTLGGGLARWVQATHLLLAGTSQDQKTRLLADNARRIYSIDALDEMPLVP